MSASQVYTDILAVALALPATGTVRTQAKPVRNRRLSIEAAWTGTPTGVFALQCSFDGGANWRTVPGAAAEFTANSQAQPAGGASSGVWNFINVPGALWSLLYTATSGTGTLNARWAAAGV